VARGIALALLIALGGAPIAACYDVPTPACGFACGPDGACPEGYTCAADRTCHLDGSPADLMCARPDAATPADAQASSGVSLGLAGAGGGGAGGGVIAGSDSTRPARPVTSPRGSW